MSNKEDVITNMINSVALVTIEGPEKNEQQTGERPFFFSQSGITKLSASGVLIDKTHSLLITSGTLFTPFLMSTQEIQLYPDVNITVSIDSQVFKNAKFVSFIQSSSADKWVHQLKLGSGEWFWGWKPDFEIKNRKSTPSLFAIIQISDASKLQVAKFSKQCFHGEDVFVVSSPFGFLSPNTFQNSISKGIVSNVLGTSRKNIMLTDARMLPGSEGGGIFNSKGELIGLCTLPLRRSDTEVEINLGICLDALIDDLEEIIGSRTLIVKQPSGIDDLFKRAKQALCVVHVAYSWASGIIVSQDGYVLTNAHLFEPHLKDKKLPRGTVVNVQLEIELTKYYDASLIFISTGPLDLALIKVHGLSKLNHIKMENPPGVTQGQKVFVVGYPLYNPNIGMSATITSGLISKVVRLGGIPTMIQTSALVHRGNSGGMLINGNGEFLGIITSNAKHHETSTQGQDKIVLIPSMNFTIPVERLITIGKAISQDLEFLKEYHLPNKKIKDIWDFKDDTPERKTKFTEFLDKMESLKQSKL